MKKLFFIYCVLPWSLICPPLEYIKGLSSTFKPEYRHLSPLNAIISLETGCLKRLLQTGDPQKASTQLLDQLFKIQDNRLYSQNNLSRPAAHFNPEILADIVAALEKKTLMTPDYQKTWQQTLLTKINSELNKKSKGRMTATKLNSFLETLKSAHSECHVKIGPLSILPYTALLGYFCLKYKSADDLVNFFQHLQHNGIDCINAKDLHAMTHDHFTLIDCQNFETNIKKMISDHSPNDSVYMIKNDKLLYETALFTEIDTTHYRGIFPPMAKESDVNFDGIQVRDCVNTAIRTFFDHLFYNRETFCFEPKKMLPSAIKPSSKLLDFYQKYPYTADVNGSPTIAYDWMKLLANRPDIVYHNEHKIEVCARGGMPNIIKILNQLCNVKDKKSEELCKLLSTEQRTLSSTSTQKGEQESLHITFQDSEKSPYTLSFELMHEHGFMQRTTSLKPLSCADYKKSIRHALLALLSSEKYDQAAHNLLSVYVSQDQKDLTEDIQKFIDHKNIPYENLIDFYSMIDIDNEKSDLILFKSACNKLKQYPHLKQLILRLIFDLRDEDTFYYYYNIKYLARYKAWDTDKDFIEVILNLLKQIKNEKYKEKAINVLVKNQATTIPMLKEYIEKL